MFHINIVVAILTILKTTKTSNVEKLYIDLETYQITIYFLLPQIFLTQEICTQFFIKRGHFTSNIITYAIKSETQ